VERLSELLGHAVQFQYTAWDRIVRAPPTLRGQVVTGDDGAQRPGRVLRLDQRGAVPMVVPVLD